MLTALPLLRLLLALTVLLALPAAVRAQAEAETAAPLAAYVAALDAAQERLDAGGNDAAALAAARAVLAPFTRVALSGGEAAAVQPVLGEAGAPLSRLAAQARIFAVREQLRRAGDDRTAVRLALLDPVWESAEFTRGETLGERFLRWFAELFDRLFPDLRPNPAAQQAAATTTELAGWAIAAIALAVLVWLLSLWLRRLLGRFVADASAGLRARDDSLPRTPAEARARADELARTGAYRDAVRNLYLAALLGLERRRLVPADRSLTNREVLAQVPADNALQPLLRPVVDTFDMVWYGVQEPDAAAFTDYAAQIDSLEQVAAGETKTP